MESSAIVLETKCSNKEQIAKLFPFKISQAGSHLLHSILTVASGNGDGNVQKKNKNSTKVIM